MVFRYLTKVEGNLQSIAIKASNEELGGGGGGVSGEEGVTVGRAKKKGTRGR